MRHTTVAAVVCDDACVEERGGLGVLALRDRRGRLRRVLRVRARSCARAAPVATPAAATGAAGSREWCWIALLRW